MHFRRGEVHDLCIRDVKGLTEKLKDVTNEKIRIEVEMHAKEGAIQKAEDNRRDMELMIIKLKQENMEMQRRLETVKSGVPETEDRLVFGEEQNEDNTDID
jgi:hypothetical protein